MNEAGSSFKATVSGRVQGVGFRYFTKDAAQELGLYGYVKNVANGSVEVFAEGDKEALNDLLTRLNKGPWGSQVVKVDVTWLTTIHGYDSFEIVP